MKSAIPTGTNQKKGRREREGQNKKGEKAGGKNPEEDNGRISGSQTRDQ